MVRERGSPTHQTNVARFTKPLVAGLMVTVGEASFMWFQANSANTSAGIRGIGGTCPGCTKANRGSCRHACAPDGPAAGLIGRTYQVPGGPPSFRSCLA